MSVAKKTVSVFLLAGFGAVGLRLSALRVEGLGFGVVGFRVSEI